MIKKVSPLLAILGLVFVINVPTWAQTATVTSLTPDGTTISGTNAQLSSAESLNANYMSCYFAVSTQSVVSLQGGGYYQVGAYADGIGVTLNNSISYAQFAALDTTLVVNGQYSVTAQVTASNYAQGPYTLISPVVKSANYTIHN